MASCHIRMYGHVQGVCFRAEVKRHADALDLSGWVKNNSDGSVEFFAQGDKDALSTLERFCADGPPGATVDRVEHLLCDADEQSAYTGFEIVS
jgi:acylphosphatase